MTIKKFSLSMLTIRVLKTVDHVIINMSNAIKLLITEGSGDFGVKDSSIRDEMTSVRRRRAPRLIRSTQLGGSRKIPVAMARTKIIGHMKRFV